MNKIEAIISGLEEHLGLVLVEQGSEHKLVKKGHLNCEHHGTDYTRLCTEGVNVPCEKWEYGTSISEHLVKCSHSGKHTACVSCPHGSNHVALHDCTRHQSGCIHIDSPVVCKRI